MSTNDNPNRRPSFDGKFAGDDAEFNHKTDYASLDAEGRAKLEKWMRADGERRTREALSRSRVELDDDEMARLDEKFGHPNPKREWEAEVRQRGGS